MLIPNKFNGYLKDGQRTYHMGDDSPAAAPTDTTVRQTSMSAQVEPYYEDVLGRAKALTNKEYQTYEGQRQAAFDPMQLQAQQNVANLGISKQLGSATTMAGLAGLSAGDVSYDPTAFANQFTAPSKYANTQFSYDKVSPTDQLGGTMTAAQMNAPANVSGFGGATKEAKVKSFIDAGTAASYMSPYAQNVTDIQTREAQRAADIAKTQRGAQAVTAGAFGGGRHAIMEAEAARNLALQKGDITARGQQEAYQQAMAQFNAEQGYGLTAQQANLQAGLQSALANQQTGLATGTQNLNAQQQANVQNLAAKLQTQGLNAQQAMQAALANQQSGITTQQLAEQSKQFGYGQEMTAAQQQAQYGLAAQQAAEQSKQFGSNLGLEAIRQQLSAASTLGQLGQTQFGQEKDIINAQSAAGAQRQAAEQQILDTKYQDFLRQEQYPYQQLSYMAEIARGTPLSNMSQSIYQAPPSVASQVAGTGLAYAGASKYFARGGLTALALHNMTK